MSEPILERESEDNSGQHLAEQTAQSEKPDWQTPNMQDVSEEVMAQPYIRFT